MYKLNEYQENSMREDDLFRCQVIHCYVKKHGVLDQ